MQKQKISLIIPVHNSIKTLKRCIESVVAQTYKNLEIILVENASIDGSFGMCQQIAKQEDRIKLINLKKAGVSLARNAGLYKATGEFIAFVDSDDYLENDMLEKLINAILETNAEIAVCGYFRLEDTIKTQKKGINFFAKNIKEFTCIFDEIVKKNLFYVPWNKLYKKEKIKSLFREEISLGEDLLFNLDYFSDCTKFVFIEDCLYNYVVNLENKNSNSLYSKYRQDAVFIEISLHKALTEFCTKKLNSLKAQNTADEAFLESICNLFKKIVSLRSIESYEKIRKIKEIIQNKYVKTVLNRVKTQEQNLSIFLKLFRKGQYLAIFYIFSIRKIKNKVMKNLNEIKKFYQK